MKYWDESINPAIGCTPISPACDNCYAATLAATRFEHNANVPQYHGLTRDGHWTGEVRLLPEATLKPHSWRQPKWIFWGNMGDLFHEAVPVALLDKVRSHIRQTRQHVHIICTKRADRMRAYWDDIWDVSGGADYPGAGGERVILMVTGEAQAWVNLRVPDLLAIRGDHLRALSAEPLLGPLDLTDYLGTVLPSEHGQESNYPITGLDWVITGDETGTNARETQREWIDVLMRDCTAASVPFFLKQFKRGPIADHLQQRPSFPEE